MKKMINTLGQRLVKQLRTQPEKIVTPVIATILVLIALNVITSLAPMLFALLSSTVFTVIAVILSGILIYAMLDRKFRSAAYGLLERGVKNIAHRFIEINPVDILREFSHHLHQQLMDMTMQMDALSRQKALLQEQILENQRKITDITNEVHDQDAIMPIERKQMKARQIGRIAESNEKLTAMHANMQILYDQLLDLYKSTEITLEDTKYQIEEKEMEYQAIKSSHDAMNAASEIISGKSKKRKVFDQAVETLANDVASKIGQMERFMDESSRVIATVDLQQAVHTDQGMQLLDQFVNQQHPALDLNSRPLNLQRVPELVLAEQQTKPTENHYDHLFNEK